MQKPIPKKLICLSLVIVVFLGLFLVNIGEAGAGFWNWPLKGLEPIALDILRGIFTVLLHIAQAFTGFIGNIFSLIVNFGFQDMEMVKKGWTITRDIVNMFFILGLVVIAFATILKIETHGMKALLPKFIIIALLINFSYLVCGLIIDVTQIAANYFAELIGENIDIGLVVLHRLDVTQSMGGGGGVVVPISDQDPDLIIVTTMIFDTFILFIVGFVLLIGAILLFIRVGALWALIILSPFAWFFSIFPGKIKGYANQWWEAFLKWAFFAPIYIFFIYLVLTISKGEIITKLGQAYGGSIPSAPAGLSALTLSPMFQNLNMLFKFIFLIVLLFGAPTIAMSMGIKGAGAARSFVRGAFRGTAKIAGRVAVKPTAKFAGRKARELAAKPMERLSSKLLESPFAKTKVGGWMAGKLMKPPMKILEAQVKAVGESTKKYSHLPSDHLKRIRGQANTTDKMGIDQILADRGDLKAGGTLSEKRIEGAIRLASRIGMQKPLLMNRPDLASAAGKTTEEVIESMKPADYTKIQAKAIENSEVQETIFKNAKGSHLSQMAKNPGAMNKLQSAINNLSTAATAPLRNAERTMKIAITFNNPALVEYIKGTAAQGVGYTLNA